MSVWESFLKNINRGDNICIFTIGRMHPFHKGHKELVCDVMRKTKQITDKGVEATAYVYLSATNEESRWITNENITNTMKGKTPQDRRALKRQINKIKARIGQSEPLPTSYRFAFLHKMLSKKSCGKNITNPIVLYDQSITLLAKDLKDNFSNGKELTRGSRERLSVPDTAMVRDSYGNLPSLKCLNYLHKQRHNKVILLVGSDRVEAFKKYNMEKMIELFGEGNALILQSGGERGDSGEGDKALDELEALFANMSLDNNSGESKVPVREDYSGSVARKKALGKNPKDIKQFLHMIDYTPDDNLADIHKLIIKIRQANGVSILGISKKIRAAAQEIDDADIYDKYAEQFGKKGPEERKSKRQQRGHGRTRKRKKRKRCSKKRLKKNMICHRGTKKKLRKLRKLTKKLKIRLTRCSKKRLKKWKVKKSRKKCN